MNETIKAAQDTLKHDYVWNKINEMIEHDVKGSPDEEFEIAEDDKVNAQSQLAFWLTFLQRFNGTGEISNFKYFVYILLVIPSHTAGLERMFKSLKEMKTKSRNRLSDKRTKKLMMILNFIDDVKIDLDRIAQIYKSSL